MEEQNTQMPDMGGDDMGKQPEEPKSGSGAMVGIIIIVIIIVLGGLYFFGGLGGESPLDGVGDETTGDETTDDLLDVDDSDEIENIESDLDEEDFEDVDEGLNEADEMLAE